MKHALTTTALPSFFHTKQILNLKPNCNPSPNLKLSHNPKPNCNLNPNSNPNLRPNKKTSFIFVATDHLGGTGTVSCPWTTCKEHRFTLFIFIFHFVETDPMNSVRSSVSQHNSNMDMDKKDDTTGLLTKRRVAIRKAKVHEHRGHKFTPHYFRTPAYCSYCNEFIWYVIYHNLKGISGL